jgi:hypothetical protein
MITRTVTRYRLALPVAAGCIVAVVLASAAGPASASSASGHPSTVAPRWRVVARTDSALDALVVPAKTDALVLGTKAGPDNSGLPAGERWNGHHWTEVNFPKSVTSGISCAGASSTSNVWAFAGASLYGSGATYAGALRVTGGTAKVSKSFTPPGLVSGCSVLSPGDIWVYGSTHVAPGVGTWRLTKKGWQPTKTGSFYLATASTVSKDDVWAIADDSSGLADVVAHWNGSSWAKNKAFDAALPKESSTVTWSASAINAVAAGNIWVGGEITRGSKSTEFVAHLSHGRWRLVGPANPGHHLPEAVSDGHGGWWAPGPAGATPARYVLHETGGHWHKVTLPLVSGEVPQNIQFARVPGTSTMLAIGQLYNGKPGLRSVVLAWGPLPG